MREGIAKILARHPDDRVLIHTVSYGRSRDLSAGEYGSRPIFTYQGAQGRTEALEGFRATPGAVLFAASMDRGIDLPDDACRVQVLTKVPYPNLGDRQVSERLYRTANGKTWYQVQVARSIMQMVGRAVRSETDHACCYVVDSSFGRWYAMWQMLLPKWFRQAVRYE